MFDALVDGINRIGDHQFHLARQRTQIEDHDRKMSNKFAKDLQVVALRQAGAHLDDKILRVANVRHILDSKKGPLAAIRLNIPTRKSLGGVAAALNGQALNSDSSPFEGLYTCGEAAGFDGGGFHGYNALKGTFLGGCIFSDRIPGRVA